MQDYGSNAFADKKTEVTEVKTDNQENKDRPKTVKRPYIPTAIFTAASVVCCISECTSMSKKNAMLAYAESLI